MTARQSARESGRHQHGRGYDDRRAAVARGVRERHEPVTAVARVDTGRQSGAGRREARAATATTAGETTRRAMSACATATATTEEATATATATEESGTADAITGRNAGIPRVGVATCSSASSD